MLITKESRIIYDASKLTFASKEEVLGHLHAERRRIASQVPLATVLVDEDRRCVYAWWPVHNFSTKVKGFYQFVWAL